MLSIVIPSHQRSDLLRACLDAVTRLAPAGTEIVVVDDASPGGAGSAVAATFAGVRSIRLARQHGFAAAANMGIDASRGDIVEMLNDDTEVQPGWAEPALRWFEAPDVGAVAPLVLDWPGGTIIDSAGDRYYLGGIAGKRGHGLPIAAFDLQPRPVFGASAAAGFFRRDALQRSGGFPEYFGSYFEDVDLAFRLRRLGYRAMFEPASRVLHHVAASHGRHGRKLLERQSCNEERVFWRNLPDALWWRALPKHLAVLAAKAVRRWHEAALTPWLFGRLRVLGEGRAIAHHRRDLAALARNIDIIHWGIEERFWGNDI
jgi:GT2 family glycosyltransferase